MLSFGKYKNKSVKEVVESDLQYSQWLISQSWFKNKELHHAFLIEMNSKSIDMNSQSIDMNSKFSSRIKWIAYIVNWRGASEISWNI